MATDSRMFLAVLLPKQLQLLLWEEKRWWTGVLDRHRSSKPCGCSCWAQKSPNPQCSQPFLSKLQPKTACVGESPKGLRLKAQ